MKKLILVAGFACLLLNTHRVFSQSFKNANEYLEFVSEEHENISKSMWKYTKAVAHNKSDRSINNKRETLIKTVERSIKKIEKADGYDGNEFKNQVLDHLKFNESLLKEDYAKIIDMKAVAEQSYDLMEAYIIAQEMTDKKMEEAQETYERNFHAFADEHNIEIIENETDLAKKMETSNAVFKYYNKLYLIYFKVYVNEIYLMDALNISDISAIQQSTNALSTSAKEGLLELQKVAPYNNDKSLIEATKKAFEFYIDEADNKMPILLDFLMLSENFQAINESLQNTPENKRTKEQVADYNKKVNEVNKGVNTFNKTNSQLNAKRQEMLNNLNAANEKFLDKHIPND